MIDHINFFNEYVIRPTYLCMSKLNNIELSSYIT